MTFKALSTHVQNLTLYHKLIKDPYFTFNYKLFIKIIKEIGFFSLYFCLIISIKKLEIIIEGGRQNWK